MAAASHRVVRAVPGAAERGGMTRLSRLRDAWLVVPSVAFALGLAELGVRVAGLSPPPSTMQKWLVEDPILPFRPAAKMRDASPSPTGEFAFEVTTNGRGFRDRERTLAKPAGTFRVIGIGDSFTWGYGAPIEETYLPRLERMLNEREGAHPRVEAISMGIGRFWPRPQRLLLEHEALDYAPDLVVVLMVDNDVYDTAMGAHGVVVSRGYLVSEQVDSLLPGPAVALLARSALGRLLFARLPVRDVDPKRFHWGDVYVENGRYESAWQEIEREYDRMLAIARERDVAILFARVIQGGAYLGRMRPAPDLEYPGRRLAAWAARSGAHFVDTLPAFERAGGHEALFWPKDGHPTPDGYRVIAETIFAAAGEGELVP